MKTAALIAAGCLILFASGFATARALQPPATAQRFVNLGDGGLALDTATGRLCSIDVKPNNQIPFCYDLYRRKVK